MRQRKAKDLEIRLRECSAYMIDDPGSGSRDYFSSGGMRELFVEIGCGKGQFIISKALSAPEADFIAIEGQETVILRALEKTAACDRGAARADDTAAVRPGDGASEREAICAADVADIRSGVGTAEGPYSREAAEGMPENPCSQEVAEDMPESLTPQEAVPGRQHPREAPGRLSNLRFMLTFVDSMEDLFDRGQVSGIYLNFSDPWPKARHAKRRLTHRDRLRDYARALRPGGFIEIKTDNDDLYDFTLAEISAAGLRITEQTRDLHHSGYASRLTTTEYEDKFSGMGKNINYVKVIV